MFDVATLWTVCENHLKTTIAQVSIAKFPKQMLSLSYLKCDFVS